MATCFWRLILSLAALLLVNARPSDTASDDATADDPPWRKYFTNDTVTGRVVPCTDKDEFCLKRGWILHEPSGKCYLYGDRGPCEWYEALRVDKEEFLQGTGRVRATCVKRDMCEDSGDLKMAYDGSCVGFGVMNEICFTQRGLRRSENLFGETECGCDGDDCPVKEAPMEMPSKDNVGPGRCVVPDLRAGSLPRLPWQGASALRPLVPCTETERRCFLDERVYFAERDLCFDLLRRGPCAEGQRLVLDREELVGGSGRLVAVCRDAPCDPGRVQFFKDGECYAPEELCGAYDVGFDVFGMAGCASGVSLRLPVKLKEEGVCRYHGAEDERTPTNYWEQTAPKPPPACPHSRTGYCERDGGEKATAT